MATKSISFMFNFFSSCSVIKLFLVRISRTTTNKNFDKVISFLFIIFRGYFALKGVKEMGNGVVKGRRWMKMWPDKGMMYNKNMIDQTAYERGI